MKLDLKKKSFLSFCYGINPGSCENTESKTTDIIYKYWLGDGEDSAAGITLYIPEREAYEIILNSIPRSLIPDEYIEERGFLAHGEDVYWGYDLVRNELPDANRLHIDVERFIEQHRDEIIRESAKLAEATKNPVGLDDARQAACYLMFEKLGQALQIINDQFEKKTYVDRYAIRDKTPPQLGA